MEKRETYRRNIIKKLEKSGDSEDLALVEIIQRAQLSDHWGHKETVKIGEAKNMREFATLIFHESGHCYHGFGTDKDEEQACYEFAKRVCQRLNLPFSEVIMRYGVTSAALIQLNHDESAFTLEIDAFPPRIREILGLSEQVQMTE